MGGLVDISAKPDVERTAVASGEIHLSPKTARKVKEGKTRKGDVLAIAEVAALQAVKRTWEIIPHCHPIPITSVKVTFRMKEDRVRVTCRVQATYKTGVEMEALTGVAAALLTLWDTVKYLEKDTQGQYPHTAIAEIRVQSKEKRTPQ